MVKMDAVLHIHEFTLAPALASTGALCYTVGAGTPSKGVSPSPFPCLKKIQAGRLLKKRNEKHEY